MADAGRVVDLAGYYPDFLRDVRELKLIARTEGKEVGRLYEEIDGLWAGGFIQTATIQGIRRWESILGIRPYPGDRLGERRAAVTLKWNQQLPYTLLRLMERLNAVLGADGYGLYVRNKDYELELQVTDQPYRTLREVQDMTRDMIPANLLFIFAALYPVSIPVDIAASSRLELMSDFYARYNREFLYLDGTWLLDGTYLLSGYKEDVGLDVYPARLAMTGGYGVPCGIGGGTTSTASIRAAPDTETAIRIQGTAEGHPGSASHLTISSGTEAGLDTSAHLRVENDLWYLDGTYLLDGTKLLDAEIFEYDL